MENIWDKRYSDTKYIYGIEPNTFFKNWLDKQKPSEILFPAEGEGRNAVYAAMQGWNVTAFDSSKEGKKKALLLAKEYNTEVLYEVVDAEIYTPNKKFDAIVLIFAHFPPNLRNLIHKNMLSFLKPGGHLVLESFSKDQLKYGTGGPKNEALLYSINELKSDFSDLETLRMKKLVRFLNEGIFHQGESDVIQLIAKKR